MKRTIAGRIIINVILILFIIMTLMPFFWTLSTSLKDTKEILSYPPGIFPKNFTFANYISIFVKNGFGTFLLNSFIVTIFTVVLSLLVSLFAGYAAARFEFPGKNMIMFLILTGMAIGKFANAMPLYFLSIQIELFDTYLILILSYSAFIIPLVTWLMQAYYKTIPRTLEEAAKLDGCNAWSAFWKVVVPVMRPSIIAGGIIAAVNAWNEFILALNLTKSMSMRTLPVALHLFMTDYGVDWGSLSAAGIVSIIPILVVFLLLQKYFVQGLTAGSLSSS